MSAYINLTTGECISGTCQSLSYFQQHNPFGSVIICLIAGIMLLIGVIIDKLAGDKLVEETK
jgi:hypothetical protein